MDEGQSRLGNSRLASLPSLTLGPWKLVLFLTSWAKWGCFFCSKLPNLVSFFGTNLSGGRGAQRELISQGTRVSIGKGWVVPPLPIWGRLMLGRARVWGECNKKNIVFFFQKNLNVVILTYWVGATAQKIQNCEILQKNDNFISCHLPNPNSLEIQKKYLKIWLWTQARNFCIPISNHYCYCSWQTIHFSNI